MKSGNTHLQWRLLQESLPLVLVIFTVVRIIGR